MDHGPLAREVPVIDPRCDAILKRFSAMDGCPVDWPEDWKQQGAPMVRRESTIYRLSSAGWNRSICVKIVNGGAQDAAGLHGALSRYHAKSDRERGYTVPEPYGLVPECGAVIMEWVEGRPVSDILKREMFLTQRRHESIRKMAGWLRWFHSQSELERGVFTKAKQLKGIIRIFEESSALDQAATAHDPALRENLNLALKSAGVVRGVAIDHANLHRDFKPTNLLISATGVVIGIDFVGGKRGPVSYDICRFLSELDFYQSLRGRSFALSHGSGSNDFDVFLAAYGGGVNEMARPAFVYLYFLAIVSILVHQRRKFKRGVANGIRLAVFRRIAGQLAGEISKNVDPAE